MFKNIKTYCRGAKETTNEDAIKHSDSYLIIIDGATGLSDINVMAPLSDAEWFSHTAAETLAKKLDDPSYPTSEALVSTSKELLAKYREQFAKQTTKDFPDNLAALPSAAMALLREKNGALEYWGFGDCKAFIKLKHKKGILLEDKALENLDQQAINQMVKLSKTMSMKNAREQIADILMHNRNLQGKDGGYEAYNLYFTDPQKAAQAEFDLSEVESVSLYSDGFLDMVYTFGLINSVDDLHQDLSSGKNMDQLATKMREIQSSDSQMEKYPRFKIKDDASAIFAIYSPK